MSRKCIQPCHSEDDRRALQGYCKVIDHDLNPLKIKVDFLANPSAPHRKTAAQDNIVSICGGRWLMDLLEICRNEIMHCAAV